MDDSAKNGFAPDDVIRTDPPVSVLHMISAAARMQGDATALQCGDRSLSYARLMQIATCNADRLRGLGVAKHDVVACALSTGIDLPVAWVAAMMVGAVIVPVDFRWPPARLQAVLHATRARVVICQAGEPAPVSASNLTSLTITVDTDDRAASLLHFTPPAGTDLLYGFFTSGSSGEPKCALNHHAGLVNRFGYMTRRFGGGHRVYQNSAPLFDSSLWQMLWPLTNGGIAVLPERRGRWDLDAMVAEVERHAITMTDFVPTLFKLLVRALEGGSVDGIRLRSLRNVLIGGEDIDAESVQCFRKMFPDCKVINTYGHTEAAIGMVFHEVRDEDGLHIPLGLPIDNTYVEIVDAAMQPVTDGETGELIVAGVCVGAGYLNAPELTRLSFLENVFPQLPGRVVYRTGDFGRRRPDGLLEYAGRADEQVKVRGVRIELGEVTLAARAAWPDVLDAVAVLVRTQQNDRIIALAYVAAAEIAPDAFRSALARHVPPTHLPQCFLRLDVLPVGANGKLDRRRIVATMEALGWQAEASTGTDERPLEIILGGFRRVLLRPEAGADDHFFDVGGDSLMAADLSWLLERRLRRPVPVSLIYRHPTPAGLDAYLHGWMPSEREGAQRLPSIALARCEPPPRVSGDLLLTGATGFLGIHVLGALLQRTALCLHLLVRGESPEMAFARVNRCFAAAFPGRSLPRTRIRLFCGDVAMPRWGLSTDAWDRLAGQVHEVVHCAADVNFLAPPSQLFAANVGGTAELIRFCHQAGGKRLHHISSLAAVLPESMPCAPTIATDEEAYAAGMTGYGYSKYLADCLVIQAQDQGLAATIYRVDDVLPAMRTGFANARSLVHLLLVQCLKQGMAPAGCGRLSLLGADALADWLCRFIGDDQSFAGVPANIDVIGQRYVDFDSLVRFVGEKSGVPTRAVAYADFLATLHSHEDREAVLLRNILPAADSGRVTFTPYRRDPSAVPPLASLLTADLGDFEHFAETFKPAHSPFAAPIAELLC